MMEIKQAMEERHSVRRYTDQPIEAEKREVLDAMAKQINAESGLHIQILYDEPTCFDSFRAHYGKFDGVRNYIALVGKKSETCEADLGYYGEKLVLAAQMLGLNTCWVALTHGKSRASVEKGEKQVCLISLGYGVTQGVLHQNKPLAEVCRGAEDAPAWFAEGVRAALMAPTAMNQQKFLFAYRADGTVCLTRGKGFYSKVDLGIVRYHFEAVTGKTVVTQP